MCVRACVSTANRPTVRLLSTLHLQHYKVTWGLLISFSSPIYLSPPLLLHVCRVLSHIPRHNPSEYWRVVVEFRLDLCSADRLHHPGGPLSPSEIVVSAAQYYCHAPQCAPPPPLPLQADGLRFHTNIQTHRLCECTIVIYIETRIQNIHLYNRDLRGKTELNKSMFLQIWTLFKHFWTCKKKRRHYWMDLHSEFCHFDVFIG